jgi:hypothetical protein
MKQIATHNQTNFSGVSLWTKCCFFGLLSIFVHVTLVLPFTEGQNINTAIAENMADTESELETEELDEVVEETIAILLPSMLILPNQWAELAVNAENNLHDSLFGPPPDLI